MGDNKQVISIIVFDGHADRPLTGYGRSHAGERSLGFSCEVGTDAPSASVPTSHEKELSAKGAQAHVPAMRVGRQSNTMYEEETHE